MNYCIECGGAQTNHRLEWLSNLFVEITGHYFPFFSSVRRFFEPIADPIANGIIFITVKVLVLLRLGKLSPKLANDDGFRARSLVNSANARGIECLQFRFMGRPTDFHIARYKGKSLFFVNIPRPNGRSSAALEWMDGKGNLREFLAAHHLSTPRGGRAATLSHALDIFRSLQKPVVVKPNLGSRSRHTTLGVRDEKTFIKAFQTAKELSPWVETEEELRGPLYRATLIGGKLSGVLRRDPAGVWGDGAHTVEELMKIANQNPRRHAPPFHALRLGEETIDYLKRRSINPRDVPTKGTFIPFGDKASRGEGGATVEVTEAVHPDNKEMFEQVARLLADPAIGLDFIIDDISRSWRETSRAGVIECNSAPFIDLHHYPLEGEARDVAGMLWEVVFPEAKNTLTHKTLTF
jgi:cyanophycin synthetase